MGKVTFNKERCKGCELCISVCPKNIIAMNVDELNNKGFHPAGVVQMELCIGCAFCATICPDCVIEVDMLSESPRSKASPRKAVYDTATEA